MFRQVIMVEFLDFEMELTCSCNIREVDHITWNDTGLSIALWDITLVIGEDTAHKLFISSLVGVLGVALLKRLVKVIKLRK